MARQCEGCLVSMLVGEDGVQTPQQAATEVSMNMWRRDWSKGESVDNHDYRGYIADRAGVSVEEAELIWNCALSQYQGNCQPINQGE